MFYYSAITCTSLATTFSFFMLFFYYFILYFFQYIPLFILHVTYINIEFFTLTVTNNTVVLFKPLQETIFMLNNDVALVFFRVFNNSSFNVRLLTTYTIFPFFYSIFLTKIQCFCFDTILLKKYCSVDLPVLFSINIPYELLNKTAIKISLVYSIFLV